MLLGLETFSYHLAFAYGKMDVFGFIKRVAELGLDGVEINVEGPNLCHLGSDDPGFLRDVRALVEGLGLYIELDTCDTNPQNLKRIIKLCQALGAQRMRVYSSMGGDLQHELKQAVLDFRQVMPLCADVGVKISFENHEFESSHDIVEVVRQVDNEFLGTHIDTGNSMMVWEDPIAATANMAPYAVGTHFKDYMVIMVNDQPMITGVPLGRGGVDCAECFRILVESSPLQQINLQVCFGYVGPFRLPEAQGYGAKLGQGSFRGQPPPYDPATVASYVSRATEPGMQLNSFTWQNLAKMARSESEQRDLLAFQDRAVVESVEYVKQLNKRYDPDR